MPTTTSARAIRRLTEADSVVVLGLGRFGSALAQELMRVGVEVLGVDQKPEIVQHYSAKLTRVVQADTTSEEALRQIGSPRVRSGGRRDRHRHRGEPC